MNKQKKIARLSGLVYLILIISGILNLMYFPGLFVVWDNPAQTLENITSQEPLFRWSIIAGITCFGAFLFLAFFLYQLLHRVNKYQALIMLMLVIVSVAISFVNILNKFSILTWISEASYLIDTPIEVIQNQVMFHLSYFDNGIQLSQIFWGLWLFPFGYLVYHSGFLPRFLGIMLMIGCFGYLTDFFGGFLFDNYYKTMVPTIVGLPATIGEFGICLWLLIKGVRGLED